MTDEPSQANVDEKVARRIESEKEYHNTHYEKAHIPLQLNFDLATEVKRKPHNLAWAYYDTILDHFHRDLTGKRILVVGCGAGATALNLARNGARVDAFDLSEQAIAICRRRAEFNKIDGVNFFVSSCEGLQLGGDGYDAVVGEMILHHIDIPTALRQFHRLLKDGGAGVFMEWKVYPVLDYVRSIALLKHLFPPGGVQQYATEYERKLSKQDFGIIQNLFPNMRLDYRYCLRGKIDHFSLDLGARVEKLDYLLLRILPFLKYFTDGVIISFTKTRVGSR
jgi:2-polyprenyl-3-methyl-5-hydroxy-6-metoxy-1,4-benzoquinol methylase